MTKTYCFVAGLVLMLAIGASPAEAGPAVNGIHLNGIHLNGLDAQGSERIGLADLARQAIAVRPEASERAETTSRGSVTR